ncbi:MAG: glycosyltransferase family 2 protein [Neomegalonema sp.]|nr:glycosyltransferase family 2 protein [Neomegalonema sp.]
MPKLAALIPAHNEILTLREVVLATRRHIETVIVIDDGSSDGSAEAIADLDVRLIRETQNLGKGVRLAQGFDLAAREGFSHVLTLDADGQHDPEDIPAFAAKAAEHPEALILGDRSGDMAQMPARRKHGIRFGNFFIGWASRQPIQDAQCGMRVYPMALWQRLEIPKRRKQGFLFETAVLLYGAEAGARFVSVPVAARYEGFVQRPSHFHPIRDFLKLFGMVTRFLITRGLRPTGLLIALGLASGRN